MSALRRMLRETIPLDPRRRPAPVLAAALLAVTWPLLATPVHAQAPGGFIAAFDAARTNDAEYRVAGFELQSSEQAVPLARAGLLPSLSAAYSESSVRGERETVDLLGRPVTQDLDYRNPVAELRLRQPLLNLEAFNRYRSVVAQVEGARSVFVARGHELLDRLGTAYVERLLAEDIVALAQAQVDAYQAQAAAAARRFSAGEGTRTDVAEATASVAFARAQLVEVIDQRDIAARTLNRVTGLDATPLRGLAEDSRALPLPYPGLQEWLDLGLAQNPNIQARRHELDAARRNVARYRAGHLPRVDLVASAVDSENESVSTLNQQIRQNSIGIQVSLPIFAGGAISASVAQALAEAARAATQLEGDEQFLAVDIRRQYQLVQNGKARIEALGEAVAASVIALEGMQRGLAAGERTTLDVLETTRRLFVARRDYVQARYETLLARLRLQTLAGVPVVDIVQDIDRHLTVPVATGS